MKKVILYFSILLMLNASDDLDSLLDDYSEESQLHKVTKVESAGELIVFSRHDLDVMQARLLEDVLKSIRGFTMQEDFRGNTELQRAGASCINSSCIRIYIDDQETSSASSGSALHIFGAYDIGHIDHIEVYLGGTALEFGHEYGFLTIKMYTKEPSREKGSQISVGYGSNSSTDFRAMTTGEVGEDINYLVYASKIDEKNDPLQNRGRTLKMQADKLNIFATLKKEDDFTVVLSHYQNDHNTPGGYGPQKTASISKFDTLYQYISLTKIIGTFKLQASYAYEEKSLYNDDVNGIVLFDYDNDGNTSTVQIFNNSFENSILKASINDIRQIDSHKLNYGLEYQKKSMRVTNIMDSQDLSHYYSGPDEMNIFAPFLEYSYNFTPQALVIATYKYENYQLNHTGVSDNLNQMRLGYTQMFADSFTFKGFASSNEVFPSLQELASFPRHIEGNVNLKPMQVKTYSAELTYKKNTYMLKVGYRKMHIEDVLKVNPAIKRFVTKSVDAQFNDYFIDYEYLFNKNNKIMLDYYWSTHNRPFVASPEAGGHIKLFNTFGKFDLYNELIYRKGYFQKFVNMHIEDGYDYNVALTYRMNKSITLSAKGENLLDRAIKAPIKGLYPVGVTDRRAMVNMEYFF